MVQVPHLLPEESIVVTLSQQLSWSHFYARDFYQPQPLPKLQEIPAKHLCWLPFVHELFPS
jgi:hypothetical protein